MCGSISLIIGLSVLLGGYFPNILFNNRAIQTSCHLYSNVYSYWCRSGAITTTCYGVYINVKPAADTICWTSSKLAVFTNQDQANTYAQRYGSQYFECYFDPNNPCTYYYGLADVTGTLYAGIVFTCLSALLFGLILGNFVYNYWTKTRNYEQIPDNNDAV